VRRIEYVREQLTAEPLMESRIRMIPDQVRRTIGFDRTMLFVPEGGELRMRAAYGCAVEGSLDLESDLFECDAYHERRGIQVALANGRSPLWLPAYKGVTSYAIAPVVREDASVAVIVGAYTDGRKQVGESDLQLLQIFAYNVRGAVDWLP
jgi:GAF domain-containing protein